MTFGRNKDLKTILVRAQKEVMGKVEKASVISENFYIIMNKMLIEV